MTWGLLALLAAGLLGLWLFTVLHTAWLQLRPPRRGYAFAVSRSIPGDPSELVLPDAPRGVQFSSWTVRSRGVDLPVWDIQGLAPDGPVFILTHGWGESRVLSLQRVLALAPIASRLIAWDLPAHGEAPRSTFTLGHREHLDLLALIDRVRSDPASHADIVLMGFSLGAGISIRAAADLASSGPVPLVIAEAPYRLIHTPARNVLELRGLPHRLTLQPALALVGMQLGAGAAWSDFDRAAHAARLSKRTHLLVLHGVDDAIAPVADGRAIAAAAPSSTLVEVPAAGHADLWLNPDHRDRCLAALREALARRAPHAPEPVRS